MVNVPCRKREMCCQAPGSSSLAAGALPLMFGLMFPRPGRMCRWCLPETCHGCLSAAVQSTDTVIADGVDAGLSQIVRNREPSATTSY
jgi:hypothetical protein